MTGDVTPAPSSRSRASHPGTVAPGAIGAGEWQPDADSQNYDSVGLIGGLFQDERPSTVHRQAPGYPAEVDWSVPAARQRGRRRRRGRIIPLIAVIVIIALCIAAAVIVRRALEGLGTTADYPGPGTGSVTVQVLTGDTSADIARTLRADDVVASTAAFTTAARRSGQSDEFQPGFFLLRHHMSGADAVTQLLNPKARVSRRVTTTEGMIEPAVLARLAKYAKVPLAKLSAASRDLANLGLPDGYGARSAEGFLFPQTYQYDPNVTAAEALQDMTSQYQSVARKLDFTAAAKALRLTPYQALTVASMIEAEARFEVDRAKIARVVYNRLARKMPLGFDSTSAYGARIAGKDPRTVNYNLPAPYNTRHTRGLPPTPIGNPGEKAMSAAIHPAAGNWLYFVSADGAGHLFFTSSKRAFDVASAKCKANKWGCT